MTYYSPPVVDDIMQRVEIVEISEGKGFEPANVMTLSDAFLDIETPLNVMTTLDIFQG